MAHSEITPFISLPDPGAYMPSPTGNRIAVRADGTQTGGGFALLETEDGAGAATPPHIHTREDEAYLILGYDVTNERKVSQRFTVVRDIKP
jgi:hypothetical protein